MMKTIMLSAFTLADAKKTTGIQRVAREVILRLDKMIENTSIQMEYLYFENAPHNIIKLNELKNIKPVMFRRCGPKNVIIRLFNLPKYVKKNNGVLVNVEVDYSASRGYVTCIPDIRPVLKDFSDKFSFKFYFKFLVLHCAKKYSKYIVTHSEYQKQQIVKYLRIAHERVKIIGHGYEHINSVDEDDNIFAKFPALGKKEEKKYFYTLGSIMPHKNFLWVYEVAKRHPEQIFAVAGAVMDHYESTQNCLKQPNIIYLGRVTDEENKALMKNCKAFILPSKHEGFGIPPLEALACGAPICISNATCLPEIYGDCAHYFDPDDYDVDLDELLKEPVGDPQKLLTKYTWDNSTKDWFNLIMEVANSNK